MKDTASFPRATAAGALVATALLMVVSVIFEPEFPSGAAERLEAIADGGAGSTISAVAFTLAQLPLLVALLAIAHLARAGSLRLSTIGATLGVIGAFGHSVYGGVAMVLLSMADDDANLTVHTALLESVESGPAVIFMAMGLIGTVLGILLLSIALWRARVAPRWVGPALWAFLVAEFVGTAFSEWASLASVVLYLAAFSALAAEVLRQPRAQWVGVTPTAAPQQSAVRPSP